jgi:hypothetical protein
MKSYCFFTSTVLIHYLYNNRAKLRTLLDKFWNGDKKQIEIPKSDIEQYIELHSGRFLKTYESTNTYNDNIGSCFYEKDKLKEILKPKDNDLEVEWKRRILYESTPRGNIMMYYDPYKLGFVYYCDTNTISNSILNAAAMKYCLAYRCRDFFVDNEITPFEKPSVLIPTHYIEPPKKKDKESKPSINNSVFAKLKDYSKKSEPKHTNNLNDKDKNNDNDKKEIVNKIKETDKCKNRFIYMGKMYNINLLQPMKKIANKVNGFSSQYLDDFKGETEVQERALSYKDYKKSATTRVPFSS